MPILLVDGDPAAVTAFVDIVRGATGADLRPDILANGEAGLRQLLQRDMAARHWTIWIGDWLSGSPEDRWQREWDYGRAIDTVGLRLCIDDPGSDRYTVANEMGWHRCPIYVFGADPEGTVDHYLKLVPILASFAPGQPPRYCGPPKARIVVVGEKRKDLKDEGFWLPFTGAQSKFGRDLGFAALRLGWTRALDIPPSSVRQARTLIAAGETAERWCKLHVGHKHVVRIPNPSWLYTFATADDQSEARGMIQRLMLEDRENEHGCREER